MSELLGGRYEPLEVVGRGAQGEVLRARDTRLDRIVALKVRRGEAASMLDEARALYGCRPHASLPLLRDDFFDGDRYVLAMDWVEGAPLQAGAPLGVVCDALGEVAAALDHMHTHTPPLVHGDVKPDNILVTPEGRAVLVDLGIATAAPVAPATGTAGFMAPEAARGEVAPAADIYSLAATAYALLTGAPPRAGTPPVWRSLTAAESDRAQEALGAGLALDPQARPRSAAALVAALRGPAPRTTNLPPEVTSFVGRAREVDTVRAGLRASRVVTLTGPGGIGKTRLALRAVTGMDEVWFAPLAAVREDDRVADAVATALGVGDEAGVTGLEALVAHFGRRDVVLVLDNCEQVISGVAAFVAELVGSCPGVRVVATSREAVGVWGEQVIEVPPLDTGSEGAPLFVARARAQRASLDLGPAAEPLVRLICERLDGLPLAIELAAANVRTTALEDLVERSSSPLDLEGPRAADPRQQTLRGLIAWSFDLLDAPDRESFAALSVFEGSIGVDEGVLVCGDRGALTRLADRSLLTLRADRYEMLETIRAFAAEQLGEATGATRDAHLAALLGLAERAAPELHGAAQTRWMDRLSADHENLRAALMWAIERGDTGRALGLATSIGRYLELRGHLREGRALLDASLALPGGDPRVRAHACRVGGMFAHRLGDHHAARGRYEEALASSEAAGDDTGVARSLHNLAAIDHAEGRDSDAVARWERALSLRRSAGDTAGIADTLTSLGLRATYAGDLTAARAHLGECLGMYEQLGDRSGVADALSNLALVDEFAGDLAAAREMHGRSLEIRRELGDRWGIATSLVNVASADRDLGDVEAAIPVMHEAARLWEELGDTEGIAYTRCALALAMLSPGIGDVDRARELLGLALRAYAGMRDHRGVAECLEVLALASPPSSIPLLAAASGLRARGGFLRTPAEAARLSVLPGAGTQTVEADFDEAVTAGLAAAGFGPGGGEA